MKKVQPMMNNRSSQYEDQKYSELTVTGPEERVSFSHKLRSDANKPERRCSCGMIRSRPLALGNGYQLYTDELLFLMPVQHEEGTFDKDLKESRMQEKVNRLKAEGMARLQTKKEDSNAATATAPAQRTVRFDTVTIREHSVQPGVNPGGTKGCPLTIGWEPIHSETLDLEVFDTIRRDRRRCIHQLKLVSDHRQQMLTNMGFTMRDINEGTRAANIARRNRCNTIARLKSSDTQEMLEGFRSNVQNLVTFGTKKRKEQKLLKPYKMAAAPMALAEQAF